MGRKRRGNAKSPAPTPEVRPPEPPTKLTVRTDSLQALLGILQDDGPLSKLDCEALAEAVCELIERRKNSPAIIFDPAGPRPTSDSAMTRREKALYRVWGYVGQEPRWETDHVRDCEWCLAPDGSRIGGMTRLQIMTMKNAETLREVRLHIEREGMRKWLQGE